jgi:hypothetical protein
MKGALLGLANRVLHLLGLELARHRPGVSLEPVHDPADSYMPDAEYRAALLAELAGIAKPALADLLGGAGPTEERIASIVSDFWETYRARPFRRQDGGSGFHNSFWLFTIARALEPRLIVESGVWKGHTTWLLTQACPGADVHGFDLTLKRVEGRSPAITWHEHDWSRYEFPVFDPARALVFFDCHVNHARRILEASARGFRHLLFDDNPPAHKLYGYGLPGVPTVAMVRAAGEARDQIAWLWCGQPVRFEVDRDELLRARQAIEHCAVLPDVGGPTRYGGFSFLTYVRLRAG